MNCPALSLLLSAAVLTVVLRPLAMPTPAMAQPLPPLPIEFNPDTLRNPGRPGDRRRGGGSRGGCYEGVPLSAIAPAAFTTTEELGVSRTDEAVGSLTTLADPVLWFYLPVSLGDTTAEFVIKDSQSRVLYQGQLSGETDRDGIVGVPLAISLNPGEAYHWFLTIDCDERDRTTVDGWIEREPIGPDAARIFNQATRRNRVALYANYGYLQDALTELAQLRLANPDDSALGTEWNRFLSRLDLADLAEMPVLSCCQLASAQSPSGIDRAEPMETEPDLAEPAQTESESTESTPDERTESPEPTDAEDSRSILQRARDRGN
ncbi:MAG: DUF928 domain-containing protein [Cyanobacteria bacterium J06606_4]